MTSYASFRSLSGRVIDETTAFVEREAGLDPGTIAGRSRTDRAAWSRHVCWLILAGYFNVKPSEIAASHNRDISTVKHGLDRMRAYAVDRRDLMQDMQNAAEAIAAKIEGDTENEG